MRSVFHTEKKIDRVWDLKGSTVGRKSNKGESVLKDLDILEEGKKLRFRNGSEREAFLKQLEIDAAFLATMGIMDYSLLLGLHNDCGDDASYSSSVDGGGGVDEKVVVVFLAEMIHCHGYFFASARFVDVECLSLVVEVQSMIP